MKRGILLLSVVLSITLITAFKFSEQKNSTQYIRIYQNGQFMKISGSNIEYQEFNVKDEMKNKAQDYNPAMKKASELSKEGWRVVSSNSDSVSLFILMEKG